MSQHFLEPKSRRPSTLQPGLLVRGIAVRGVAVQGLAVRGLAARGLSLVLIFFFVTGCTSMSEGVVTQNSLLKQGLGERGLDPEQVIKPLALNDEIRAWAHTVAPAELYAEQKLERLAQAMLSEDFQLEYSWGYTGTAVEVYEQRRANCLAFTNLFVAMAREVGVPVFFLAVETETYRKRDEFVVVSDHVAVGFGESREVRVFDFSEAEDRELTGLRRISDFTALAMYHSNRGAEMLQQNQLAETLEWLDRAIKIDPDLPSAWVNLGVARRRAGDASGAEQAYRHSLELDPRTYGAYQNLSALLRLAGRVDEAEELEGVLKRSPNRNPYTYISLGDVSFRSGRFAEARRFYRRAAQLGHEDAEAFAALGHVALVTGDVNTARRMLRKARRHDLENARAVRLAGMMGPGSS